MGGGKNEDLRVQFDRRLKLKFLGSKVTTDAGLLAYRESMMSSASTALSTALSDVDDRSFKLGCSNS